jgi:arsenate reductase (thioredoxin)
MSETNSKTVLFVCEHGSAKSVAAAAQFNKIARESNLNFRAISRGTDPDEEFPPNILQGLSKDGLNPGEAKPLPLSQEDFAGAERVIIFNELPAGFGNRADVEHWRDLPAVSENYDKASNAIAVKVIKLLNELKTKK